MFEEDVEDSDSDSEPAPYTSGYQPPVPPQPTVLGKPKAKKPRATGPPPLPEVTRIMEMGFLRKQVEYAIKALGGLLNCPSLQLGCNYDFSKSE